MTPEKKAALAAALSNIEAEARLEYPSQPDAFWEGYRLALSDVVMAMEIES